jgi:hypothetical protein
MSCSLYSSIKRPLAAALLLGSLYASAAGAATIDFGSLPQESVDGVTVDGVTFGYTEFGSSSPEALFNVDIGAGSTVNVQTPALVGFTDGVLKMSFAQAIQHISFGVAETTNLPLTDGFTVSLFNAAGALVESEDIDTNPLALFSEGLFDYDGQAVSSVVISFDSVDANQFALGSIDFTAVPEPATSAILGMGLVALATVGNRRRRI